MPDQQDDHGLVIPGRIGKILLKRHQTLAVAESVTSGQLQTALSLADDARIFYQGGITVYNLGQKARHLFVDPILAESCNCVSEEVAAQMAKQVTAMFTADWGIAITGYAAPVPEKNIHELFACYAIYSPNDQVIKETVFTQAGSPRQVQEFYTKHVLDHFLKLLLA